MKRQFLASLLIWLLAATAAYAQSTITLPIAAAAVADIGNGPIKVRVTQGNASIFTSQGSGVGSTVGTSTALILTAIPTTAPIVGGLISGSGITSGTSVAAYDGVTSITLSAAMSVPGGSAVAWGAACPASAAGIPTQFIRASVMADYYLLYTQARVCAISPGGPANTLLILPIFYDSTTATASSSGGSGAVSSVFGRAGAVVAVGGDYTVAQVTNALTNVLNNALFYVGSAGNVATGVAMGGDCTLVAAGTVTCTKTGGVSFAASATTDTTNATNISSGTLGCARLPAFTGDVTNVACALTVAAGAISVSKMANMNANTVLSNWTGGAAAPVANVWPACANDGAHALVYINGTGLQCANLTSGGVSSIAGATGALSLASPLTLTSSTAITLTATITPQGRVTLVSATPVMTSSQSGKTSVFYTPYVGNLVPLYDGTNFIPTAFSEVSQATTDATKSPAAVGASSCYDLFAWSDAGTFRVTRGPVWTNITTRSAGTALTLTNGINLNSVTITNGPAALRGTFVGTICSNGSSTIDFIFGAAAANGTAAVLNVWNTFNRVTVGTVVSDTTASWAYRTTTWRSTNNSNTNRVTYVYGLSEDTADCQSLALTDEWQVLGGSSGCGLDSTSATPVGAIAHGRTNSSSTGRYSGYPGIGQHFFQQMEYGSSDASGNWYGAGSYTAQQGLTVQLRM